MNNTREKAFQKYLIPNESHLNSGIICTTAGFQNVSKNESYPLLTHPMTYSFVKKKGRILSEYQILYITNGKGHFISNSVKNEIEINPGSIILLFPGEWHSYAPDPDTGWEEHWIGFKGEHVDQMMNSGFFNKNNPVLRIGLHASLMEYFKEVYQIASHEKSGVQYYIGGIISHILGFIYYNNNNILFENNPIVDKIHKAQVIMRDRIFDNPSPEDIAKELGLGYTWFRRTFKEYVGSSPGRYQLQLKHLKAKEMLINSHYSISEIAFNLGFENISQFSTFFKKYEGVPPSSFRFNNIFKVND